ncbi:MAG: 23S rRNA (uracil(1939)-C(5))-methyltransferase RlmD [Firmicutes bacterium]|nr:23S rRNA (uracil(1939)-C(5))-methyltransferase RlmD [Bacillota bacterium]
MPKKKELIELYIDELAFPNKGRGLFEGERVTVKNTLPGEKVLACVTKAKHGRIEAALREIMEKAPYEIEPKCGQFGICGGCAYQNISCEKENEIKKNQVLKLLETAGIKDFEFEGILSSPDLEGYRNKCEFSFGDSEKGGTLQLGMRKTRSMYEVASLADCNIIDSDYRKIAKTVLEFFRSRNETFFHKKLHEGFLRHLVVRKGRVTGEILVNLVTSSQSSLAEDEFVNALLGLELAGKITGILHTVNDNIADVVAADEMRILYGKDFFTEKIMGLEFKVTPFSFFQTNSKGAEVLYSVAKDYAGDSERNVIFDLYCGTGTIAQIMSSKAKKVIGVELVEEAVEAAKENARRNGIENCEFIAGDVGRVIETLEEKPDVIIVDPPREGLRPNALEKLVEFDAPEIIYISCKPTSLARDLSLLAEKGYKAEKIKCVNQFPRTRHIETVCLLKRE